MPDEATSTATPDPTGQPQAGEAQPATESASSPTPPGQQATPAQPSGSSGDTTDDVYEQAFAQILADDAPAAPAENPDVELPGTGQHQDQTASGQQTGQTDPQPPQLSDDQVQLLSRMHMSPEMIAHWTPQQRQEFLDNAAKREADQTRSYKELRDRLAQLEQQGGRQSGQQDQSPEGQPGEQPDPPHPGQQETPAGGNVSELAQEAQQVVDDLVDVYGDEMKPLGTITNKLVNHVDTLQGRLEQSEQAGKMKDQLLVNLTLRDGMRDLKSEFPSLDKPEARQKVLDRFHQDWQNPSNPHRQGQGSILDRVSAALRDAAQAEFGQTSESAAQVALANRTKERLNQQPPTGSGKGRPAQLTEDDVYDQAFQEHLKPEVP